ncbi:MAG: hypothetical protein GXP55_14835 [Deltaproteobacteria bacterium]|nr:hypothetical protein [Deltaproteobacteria bacterium]
MRDHRRVGDDVFTRFSSSRAQTLWYYRAVLSALEHGFEHPIVEELRRMVKLLHRLAGEHFEVEAWPCPEPPANDV